MAKIKNWEKVYVSQSASRLIRWKNSKNKNLVEVSSAVKFWIVEVIGDGLISSVQYPTKKQAMDSAILYMKQNSGSEKPESKKIKVAYYRWGEYREDEEMTLEELQGMDALDYELDGFNVRSEDEDKTFYADPNDIDSGADGTSVKYAYATKTKVNQ